MFSIVIPLFNKQSTIERTIKSILSQSFTDFELLIIDDGSTDNSCKIASEIQDSRIKIFRKENGGVSSARNYGISMASKNWIVFLDADDYWNNSFLFTLFELINEHPNQEVFATAYVIKYDDNTEITPVFFKMKPNDKIVVENYFERVANGSNLLTCSSTCIHYSVFERSGVFPIGEKMGEDQDLWIRIASTHTIVFFNKPLVVYNIGATSAVKNILPHTDLSYLTRLRHILNTNPDKNIRKYLNKEELYIARVNILNGAPNIGRKAILQSDFSFFLFSKCLWLVLSLGIGLINKLKKP